MGWMYFIAEQQYRYYYEQLHAAEKKAYDTMLQGLMQQKEMIFLKLSEKKVQHIYNAICRDVPEIFFVKDVSVKYSAFDTERCIVLPQYRFDPDTCAGMFQEMEKNICVLLGKMKDMNELEKEMLIHDFLIDTVTYCHPGKPYSHTVAGPLLYGIGVCEGMAKAFKYIADRADLKSAVIVGTASGGNPVSAAEGIPHAWNVAALGEKWYHLDVTYDAALTAEVKRYDYFNLSESQISADHIFETAPPCPVGMDYYKWIGKFADTPGELQKLARNHLTVSSSFVFQLPEELKRKKDTLPEYLLKLITDAVGYPAAERKCVLTCNFERMVFQVSLGADKMIS